MELKTKREIKDKVFVLDKNKIVQLSIKTIHVVIGSAVLDDTLPITEQYWLVDENNGLICNANSDKCFDTKQELIKSLE